MTKNKDYLTKFLSKYSRCGPESAARKNLVTRLVVEHQEVRKLTNALNKTIIDILDNGSVTVGDVLKMVEIRTALNEITLCADDTHAAIIRKDIMFCQKLGRMTSMSDLNIDDEMILSGMDRRKDIRDIEFDIFTLYEQWSLKNI